MRTVSRYKLCKNKILSVYGAAENSIGINAGKAGITLEITLFQKQLDGVETSIKRLETEIDDVLKEIPCARNLLSIKGIGNIVAATLIGEIGNVANYGSVKDVVKLAGLNLYSVSSGKHVGNHRITKRGRHLLRKVLYFATMSMVRKGGIFHERYESLLASGKHRMVALTILSRKLLRISFAIMRDEVNYQPEVEAM
jgi:transposase